MEVEETPKLVVGVEQSHLLTIRVGGLTWVTESDPLIVAAP